MRHAQPKVLWIGVLAVAAAGTASAAVNPQVPPRTVSTSQAGKRNVLLLIADDVGADKIAPIVDHYNRWPPSDDMNGDDGLHIDTPDVPNIQALAAAGVTFVNAWSSPSCSATRAGVYTGTYASHNLVYEPGDALATSSTTLAEALSPKGYSTGLFGKWHLGAHPVTHGWDTFKGALGGAIEDYHAWTKDLRVRAPMGTVTGTWTETDYATYVNVDDAVAWINASSGRFMATVAFNAAHYAENGQTLQLQDPDQIYTDEDEAYAAIVEDMDEEIGRLLEEIDPAKLRETTIIFMGDNGTERERTDHYPFCELLGRAKGSAYEGGVSVALIIADGKFYLDGTTGTGKGRVASPGRVSGALVQTVDLFATIAAIAGSTASTSDSMSLVPLLEGTQPSVRTHTLAEAQKTSAAGALTTDDIAVRDLGYKLVVHLAGSSTSCEVFDLSSDRWEVSALTAPDAAVVDALENAIYTELGRPVSCP